MVQHGSTVRRHDQGEPPSPTASRLIILVFVTAGAIGLLAGAGWLAYTFVTRTAGG